MGVWEGAVNERTHIDLFSGIGGFALAASWNGVRTVQFCEIDRRCREFLSRAWPGVPCHDDVRSFHYDVADTGPVWLLTGASPASLPPEPVSSAEARTTAGSGRRLADAWPKSGLLGRCSRILLESETWASPEYSLKWKPSATTCGCLAFRLVPSARHTGESDTGLWGTHSRVDESGRTYQYDRGDHSRPRATNGGLFLTNWPTPAARDEKGQTQNPERPDYVPNIVKATWPTVRASDGDKGTRSPEGHALERKRRGNGCDLPTTAAHYGMPSSGCLARTESFVVRLMTLSAWLMGYTGAYLAHWETASSRRSRRESSQP